MTENGPYIAVTAKENSFCHVTLAHLGERLAQIAP